MRRLALLGLLVAGCHPTPAPAPVPGPADAGTTMPVDAPAATEATDAGQDDFDGARAGCGAACANLAALGCPEGADGPRCVDACAHVTRSRLVREWSPGCQVRAHTREAARSCAGIVCAVASDAGR